MDVSRCALFPRRYRHADLVTSTVAFDDPARGEEVLCDSWVLDRFLPDRRKALMASKDKGGRSSKTPATKTAKEKRQAKRDKKGPNG